MVTIVERMLKWITVLLSESNGVLLSAEREHHVGQRVCPALGTKTFSDMGFDFGKSESAIIIMTSTHVEDQPIRGFSQRSLVSKSIFHLCVFLTPDCMALRAGTKMRTLRVLICSSGTPVTVVMS